MKRMLIAAGMAAMLLGAAPAVAAPVASGIEAPQDRNAVTGGYGEGYRDDAVVDRRGDRWRDNDRRRDGRWDNRRDNRDWRGNGRDDRNWRGRHRGWGNNCKNVRRHHRWVRVCYRR
ncbi:MAG: hypothetical protein ABIQ43_06390 [Sphingomonas sp.]